jgi:hypothetical protein
MTFGAAFGVSYLKNTVEQVNNTTAATGRLAKNLGTSTDVVTKWGRAVEASVGGSADEAVGSLRAFHDNLLNLKLGMNPGMMGAFGLVSRYSGMSIKTAGEDEQSILLQLGDAAKKMGPEKASLALAPLGLGQDAINFLELGRAGMLAALAKQDKIGAPTDADAAKAALLQDETNRLSQAFGQLRQSLVADFTPTLVALLRKINSYVTGTPDTDPGAGIGDDSPMTPTRANALATFYARDRRLKRRPGESMFGALKRYAFDPEHTQDSETTRLTKLFQHMPVDDALKQLDKEEAGAPKMTFSAAGSKSVIEHLADLIPRLERSGDNATSPKGAQGRYQLMPATAAHYGVDPTNPVASRNAAVAMLTELYNHYKGDRQKTIAGFIDGQPILDADIAAHGDRWRDFLGPNSADYVDRYVALEHGGAGNSTVVNIGTVNGTTGKAIAQDLRTDLQKRGLVMQSTSAIN